MCVCVQFFSTVTILRVSWFNFLLGTKNTRVIMEICADSVCEVLSCVYGFQMVGSSGVCVCVTKYGLH